MAEIEGIPLGQITGGQPTDDGTHVLIRAEQSSGAEIVIAVADEELGKLISACATGHMDCRKIRGVPLAQRDTFTVTWWELGFDPTNKAVVLSLTFGARGRLDFSLPGRMPMEILETLRSHLEPSTPETPDKPLN